MTENIPPTTVAVHAEAAKLATASVLAMSLPNEIEIPATFEFLGPRVNGRAQQIRERLVAGHGTKLPFLVALALREMWFACWNSAHYMRLIGMAGRKSAPALWTAEGYAEDGGWVQALHNELSTKTNAGRWPLLKGTPYTEPQSSTDLMSAIHLYWLVQADAANRGRDPAKASDCLDEAYEALILKNGIYMWDEGSKFGKEEAADNATDVARSSWARAAAHARHAENRAMKLDVFIWCDENMANAVSMDAAASQIAGSLVPVAWRTARDWIAEWKKLRSAGTA